LIWRISPLPPLLAGAALGWVGKAAR